MYTTKNKRLDNSNAGCFLIVAGVAVNLAALITHVVVCIQTEKWGLLIAGALATPVGILHGFGVWFGFWS